MMADTEEIIADADGADEVHGDLFEITFESEIHAHVIFTKKRWKGRVKITIERISEEKHFIQGRGA